MFQQIYLWILLVAAIAAWLRYADNPTVYNLRAAVTATVRV